jgi:hypothetical protein
MTLRKAVEMAVRKASFNLPEEEIEELRRLADERRVSVTQALRQAIQDSSFIQEQVREKSKLLVEKKDGSVREVAVHR